MAMQFRELSVRRDGEEIAEYLGRLYSELFGPQAVLSDADFASVIEQWRRQPNAHWSFVAERDNGEVAAFFNLAESLAFFAQGRYGILNELWVAPAERSRGVGKEVIAHCVRFGRRRGWRRIDVSAPPDARWDRSFAFYQKRGFSLTGRKLKILIDDEPRP